VPVTGLHLTFGADPARQMVASWITDSRVSHPRVIFGALEHGFGTRAQAITRTYVDGTSARMVYVHHAPMLGPQPGTDYVYAVQHDGSLPDAGTFMTAPTGRIPFTFTSSDDTSKSLAFTGRGGWPRHRTP
jgi:hypothetical protein